jgi:hypothetical protein
MPTIGSIAGSVGKLNASKRAKLPKSTFGLPGERKYPMPDKSHAANAKARATQQVKKGNLSPASAAKIRAKADRILGKKKRETYSQVKKKVASGKI